MILLSFHTGNPEPLSELSPCITVKQERVEGMCYSSAYNNTAPSATRRNRTSSQAATANGFCNEAPSENNKAEHLIHSSHPEIISNPASPIHAESSTTSGPALPNASLFFPWQPREGIRKPCLEAAKSAPLARNSYLSFPAKRVVSRFRTTSAFPGNFSERQRHFGAEMMVDSAHLKRQQTLQQLQANRGLSLIYENENGTENSITHEELGPRPPLQSLTPPRGTQQIASLQQNGSTQPSEKTTNSKHLNSNDEEPVWKKYQWYRDRKRPYCQQTKRHKAEQPIFMKYNEIRDQRFKEGRVVSDKRRLSEPWSLPLGNESDPPSPSSHNSATNFQSSQLVTLQNGSSETSGSQTKRRKLSHDSALPEKNRLVIIKDNRSGDQNSLRERHTEIIRRYNTGESYSVDENGNFEEDVKIAQNALSSCEVKSRNDSENTVQNGKTSSHHKGGEISNVVYGDRVDVRQSTLHRYPQNVAKILRLNRIVKAVRNNRIGQQTAEKMKQEELDSRHNGFQDRDEDSTHSVQRQQSPSEYNQDDDNQGSGHDSPGETVAEERTPNNTFIGFLCPEGDKQHPFEYGHKNNFEASPELPRFTQSSPEQVPFVIAQDDNDPICQVNGLLSLPGLKETKFSISLGELKRRMNPPETLTRVEMISYIRQAKSSGRFLLDRNNIITANRSHPTILSRLCESEAQVLANGILKMNKEYLPMALMARKTVDAYKDDGCRVENCEDCRLKLRRRTVDIEITRLVSCTYHHIHCS